MTGDDSLVQRQYQAYSSFKSKLGGITFQGFIEHYWNTGVSAEFAMKEKAATSNPFPEGKTVEEKLAKYYKTKCVTVIGSIASILATVDNVHRNKFMTSANLKKNIELIVEENTNYGTSHDTLTTIGVTNTMEYQKAITENIYNLLSGYWADYAVKSDVFFQGGNFKNHFTKRINSHPDIHKLSESVNVSGVRSWWHKHTNKSKPKETSEEEDSSASDSEEMNAPVLPTGFVASGQSFTVDCHKPGHKAEKKKKPKKKKSDAIDEKVTDVGCMNPRHHDKKKPEAPKKKRPVPEEDSDESLDLGDHMETLNTPSVSDEESFESEEEEEEVAAKPAGRQFISLSQVGTSTATAASVPKLGKLTPLTADHPLAQTLFGNKETVVTATKHLEIYLKANADKFSGQSLVFFAPVDSCLVGKAEVLITAGRMGNLIASHLYKDTSPHLVVAGRSFLPTVAYSHPVTVSLDASTITHPISSSKICTSVTKCKISGIDVEIVGQSTIFTPKTV